MIGHGQAIKSWKINQEKLFKLTYKKKNKRKNKKCESMRRCSISVIGRAEGEVKEKNVICEAIVGEDFPKLMADRKKKKVKYKALKFYR